MISRPFAWIVAHLSQCGEVTSTPAGIVVDIDGAQLVNVEEVAWCSTLWSFTIHHFVVYSIAQYTIAEHTWIYHIRWCRTNKCGGGNREMINIEFVR